jgi:hypothetical protein
MRLYVPLNRQEYEVLERLAFAERRRPQDQAAVILAQALADEPGRPPAGLTSAPVTEAAPSHRSRETERVSA